LPVEDCPGKKGVMNIDLYEQDFYRWTMSNARLLRQGRFSEIDAENIAEELESMGRRERRALTSRLAVLLAHLIKWELQPSLRSRSWKYTVKEQRRKIAKLLGENPGFKSDLESMVSEAYEDAFFIVLKETELEEEALPSVCPYSFEQAMEDDFWPGEEA